VSLAGLPPLFSFKREPSKGNGNMVERKHFCAIAAAAQATLQSFRKCLDATQGGEGTPLSDALYFQFESRLGELRRRMAAAGYFSLRRRSFPTEEETIADAALRTLAKTVGEKPQAPLFASTPVPLVDEAFAARLAPVVEALEGFLPVSQSSLADRTTEQPKTLLTGWHEIVAALEMQYSDRKKIKSLNDRLGGPITDQGSGTKPMVYREDLLAWWNTMAMRQQELANQNEGRKLSAEAQHNYGRDGKVVPEIAGAVKKRRRDKRT
jgi:hypothetical protein